MNSFEENSNRESIAQLFRDLSDYHNKRNTRDMPGEAMDFFFDTAVKYGSLLVYGDRDRPKESRSIDVSIDRKIIYSHHESNFVIMIRSICARFAIYVNVRRLGFPPTKDDLSQYLADKSIEKLNLYGFSADVQFEQGGVIRRFHVEQNNKNGPPYFVKIQVLK